MPAPRTLSTVTGRLDLIDPAAWSARALQRSRAGGPDDLGDPCEARIARALQRRRAATGTAAGGHQAVPTPPSAAAGAHQAAPAAPAPRSAAASRRSRRLRRALAVATAAAALALAAAAAGADPMPAPPRAAAPAVVASITAPAAAPIAAPAAAPAAPAAAPIAVPAAPAAIDPAPRFELLDRGDAVEIIAHNIKAARTAVLPVRSRLEVPITGAPQARRIAPGDATVKLIELDREDATHVLSVKLGFERADVKALSRFAQAIQVGDDLHLLVPRKLPAGDVAPRLPDPTLPPAMASRFAPLAPPAAPAPAAHPAHPAPAAPVAPVAPAFPAAAAPAAQAAAALAAPAARPAPAAPPVLGPRPDPAAPASAPVPAATAAVPPAASTDDTAARRDATAPTRPRSAADALAATAPTTAAPAPSHAAPPAPHPLSQALATERDDAWSRVSMYAALGLAAAGLGLWMLRRRRGRPGPVASIDVIAQRSLGGKARIVWLSAGQREMIVAVTAQQVRMLGQWRKTESPAALPSAHTHADAELHRDLPIAPSPLDKPLSPAVSGLLRLRGRTGQFAAVAPEPDAPEPDAADDLTDDDSIADAAWAKEILAATGARR